MRGPRNPLRPGVWIVFTALFTLHLSARFPDGAVSIIRRWVRGVPTVVVGLTLIAVAGFEIDRIWTFVTVYLAVVANGFVAVSSSLSNSLATLVILIRRPFNIGERIEALPDVIEGRLATLRRPLNAGYLMIKGPDHRNVRFSRNCISSVPYMSPL